jgi:hypothetical protein
MKKTAIISAMIGLICFLGTNVFSQGTTTAPSTVKATKATAVSTPVSPAVAKTVTPGDTSKTAKTTTTTTTTPAPASTKCQTNTGVTHPCCQKKCAASGTSNCTMPCTKKADSTKKTVVPKN